MDKDYFIKLTLAVYRVTELFPRNEPLKFFLREKACQILADSILIFSKNPINLKEDQKNKVAEQILRNIEVLNGYFEVAKAQEWLKKTNFFVLEKEYGRIEEEIKKKFHKKEKETFKPILEKNSLQLPFDNLRNERCKRILEILRQKQKAQIWEFKEIFPQVSKRTLRRDFEYLLNRGLVERIGDGKWTYYRIK
jgi:DNA-binding transcriptional ArsR family regulator